MGIFVMVTFMVVVMWWLAFDDDSPSTTQKPIPLELELIETTVTRIVPAPARSSRRLLRYLTRKFGIQSGERQVVHSEKQDTPEEVLVES